MTFVSKAMFLLFNMLSRLVTAFLPRSKCLWMQKMAWWLMAAVIFDETEVDVFLEFSCFFYDPMDVGNFIFGSSAFSKSSFNIWKFSVHVHLKPSLENFEHYFASLWDKCNSVVVDTFLALPSFEIGMKKWAFPVLWPLLSFPNLLAYWLQHFHSIIFQDLKQLNWNSITSTSFVHRDAY